jgi:hypothetical protein
LSVTIPARLELNRREGIVIAHFGFSRHPTVFPWEAFEYLLISTQVQWDRKLRSRCLLHLVGPHHSVLIACDINEEEIRRRAWQVGSFLRLDVLDDTREWVDRTAVPRAYRHERLGKPIREQDTGWAGDQTALPQAPASFCLAYEWRNDELVLRVQPDAERREWDWFFYLVLAGKLVVMASAVLLSGWMLFSPRPNPNDPTGFLCPSLLLIASLAWVCRWVWQFWRKGLPKPPEPAVLGGLTASQRGLALVYQKGGRLSETTLPVDRIHDVQVIAGGVYIIMDTRDFYLLSLTCDEAEWLRGAIVRALRSCYLGTNTQGITANRKGDLLDIRAEPGATADRPRDPRSSDTTPPPA